MNKTKTHYDMRDLFWVGAWDTGYFLVGASHEFIQRRGQKHIAIEIPLMYCTVVIYIYTFNNHSDNWGRLNPIYSGPIYIYHPVRACIVNSRCERHLT